MKLYFVRHGESEANVTNEFSNQDHTKHPLTATGRAQVQALAEKLRAVNFTAIYASPLLRAQQTAQILNAAHGLEIQTTTALSEHNAGNLEGRADPAAWQAYSTLFETWLLKRDLDARMPGGESFNEMRTRFMPFITDVINRYADSDANILLVAHGGIYHSMLPLLLTNVGYTFGYKHILGNAALIVTEQRAEGLVCLVWDGVALTPTGSIVHEV
ncbi:MAG: histidine phosphatase family protein [Chloroflexi bacterium]|nr:histidine phosphatase family protein [Chloroflexota bacterium]